MNPDRSGGIAVLRLVAMAALLTLLGGCNVDSYFNPSVSGYWESYPSSIPIIDRIDVIERDDDGWGQTTSVTPEDLIPSDLSYRVVPGDVVTISIYELFSPGVWSNTTRRVEAAGTIRVPELGDLLAAGRTAQEIEDAIEEILSKDYMLRPQVDVLIEDGGAFNYTIYGAVGGPGLYALRKPDLRILDALAIAGGVSPQIDTIFVIRQVALSEETKSPYDRAREPAPEPDASTPPPVDIEGLIDELEEGGSGGGGTSPGALPQDQDPIIDIEDLEPVRDPDQPQVDIDDVRRDESRGRPTWMYVEELGEWVRVQPGEVVLPSIAAGGPGEAPLYAERIIEIDNQRLLRGESQYNIVIRPGDRIYVEEPPSGFVYIEGAINRPGTYGLPARGMTLSRLVAAAGGFGQIAIPSRVDLVRMVGENREAAIQLNLGAIRHRTEPDVMLKPDDHVIVGTNFWALPLAVVRSGFRSTYGFGFLLDRNFGNDVFGGSPSNNFNN